MLVLPKFMYRFQCTFLPSAVKFVNKLSLNFANVWATSLLHIRDASGSNLDNETNFFLVLLRSPGKLPEEYFKLGHDRFLSHVC